MVAEQVYNQFLSRLFEMFPYGSEMTAAVVFANISLENTAFERDAHNHVHLKVGYDLQLAKEYMDYFRRGKYHPEVRANFLNGYKRAVSLRKIENVQGVEKELLNLLKSYGIPHMFLYLVRSDEDYANYAYALYGTEYKEHLAQLRKVVKREENE